MLETGEEYELCFSKKIPNKQSVSCQKFAFLEQHGDYYLFELETGGDAIVLYGKNLNIFCGNKDRLYPLKNKCINFSQFKTQTLISINGIPSNEIVNSGLTLENIDFGSGSKRGKGSGIGKGNDSGVGGGLGFKSGIDSGNDEDNNSGFGGGGGSKNNSGDSSGKG